MDQLNMPEQGHMKNFMQPKFENTLYKREKYAVSLRKNKTQAILKAKRKKIFENLKVSPEELEKREYMGYPPWIQNSFVAQTEILKRLIPEKVFEQEVDQLIFLIETLTYTKNLDQLEQLAILTSIRQIVAGSDSDDLTQILTQTPFMHVVDQILAIQQSDELIKYLQLEATWILINLVSIGPDKISEIVISGTWNICSHLDRILQGNDLQLIHNTILLIGNICADGAVQRNKITEDVDILKLAETISNIGTIPSKIEISIIQLICWLINLMTKNMNQETTDTQYFLELYKMLQKLSKFEFLESQNQQEIGSSISQIAEVGDDDFIKVVAEDKEMVEIVFRYVKSPIKAEQKICLRILGSLFSSSDSSIIDIFIKQGILNCLENVFDTETQIKISALWVLSNITAGTDQQISAFTENQALMGKVFDLMKSEELNLRKESMIVLTNLIQSTQSQIYNVRVTDFQEGALIERMVECLRLNDSDLIMEVLQAMNILLDLDNSFSLVSEDQIAYKFEIVGGLDELERLEQHPNLSVYEQCEQIIKRHFQGEERNE